MEPDLKSMVHDNRKISIQLECLTTKELGAQGFTTAQAYVLLYILEHPDGTFLTDIHQELGVSMASLSSILKRLKSAGYVRTEQCPGDDRRKLLFGTDKGKNAWDFLQQAITRSCSQVFDGFSAPEISELDRMQKKMLFNLSKYAQNQQQEVL